MQVTLGKLWHLAKIYTLKKFILKKKKNSLAISIYCDNIFLIGMPEIENNLNRVKQPQATLNTTVSVQYQKLSKCLK